MCRWNSGWGEHHSWAGTPAGAWAGFMIISAVKELWRIYLIGPVAVTREREGSAIGYMLAGLINPGGQEYAQAPVEAHLRSRCPRRWCPYSDGPALATWRKKGGCGADRMGQGYFAQPRVAQMV